MRIRLLMLGKTRRGEAATMLDDYVKRIGRSCAIEVTEVRDGEAAVKKLDAGQGGDFPPAGCGRQGVRFGGVRQMDWRAARSRDAGDHLCVRRCRRLSGKCVGAREAKDFSERDDIFT